MPKGRLLPSWLEGVEFVVGRKPLSLKRCPRAARLRLHVATLCLSPALAMVISAAQAQTLTPDMLSPTRDGVSAASELRLGPATDRQNSLNSPNSQNAPNSSQSDAADPDAPAPSRIGKIPTYGVPPAAGAAVTGYNSLNRRKPLKKPYPGEPKAPVSPGPGSPIPIVPEPPLTVVPSSLANKPPLPPALIGTVPGQPLRKRLKPDIDPFGPVGDYAGSFLVKSAVEVSGGYNSNPGRFTAPRGSPFYMISPEFLMVSDWSRHAVIADLRGSFTGYSQQFPSTDGTVSGVPENVDRPDFIGHVDGRLDVSKETRLTAQGRLRVATDNPGSPNVQFGLAKYPLFAALGTTLGLEQDYNRLSFGVGATFDRITYQDSKLTDGTSSSNIDRNYNQTGGVGRASYDILPGLRPFVEISADTRKRDTDVDRLGFNRNSSGASGRVGSTFELTRLITGEASIGYGARMYQDARLANLTGLLTTGVVTWQLTPLTALRAIATTSLDETTLANASGVVTRTYTGEVVHDFRRWLTGIGRFTYGTLDYQGAGRTDELYSASLDVIYRLSREWQLKAQIRRDDIKSNVPGSTTTANTVMVGVRAQN